MRSLSMPAEAETPTATPSSIASTPTPSHGSQASTPGGASPTATAVATSTPVAAQPSPSSASGRAGSYYVGGKAHLHTPPDAAPAGGAAPGAASTACASGQLCYNGGSTMKTSRTYAIYWLPSGTHFESPGSISSDSNFESIVNNYLSKVGNTGFYNLLTQYSTTNYTIQNTSSFGGSCVDTTPYSSVGGGHHGTSADPLLDTDIEAEVANAISVCNFSNPDTMTAPTVEFFIITGLDVESCFDSGHNDCSATDTNGNADYCAYHSYSDVTGAGKNAIYGNMPDMSTRCSSGISPNNDSYADNLINVMSHEHFESVTDPYLNAWYDSSGNEVGDKCAWQFGSGPSDVTLNGNGFFVQKEWSNASSGCALSYQSPCTALGLVDNPSSSTVTAGTSVAFTATGTCQGSPVYKFSIGTEQGSNVTWQTVQAYGTSNTYTWNTTGLATGSYQVRVWIENQGGGSTTFDVSKSLSFTVNGIAPCSGLSLTASPSASTVASGTHVLFTASATCGGTANYQFFVGTVHGSNVTWQTEQGYSTTNTYTWNTTGSAPGSYDVRVWVQNQGGASTSFDATSQLAFTITGQTSCSNLTLSDNPTSTIVSVGSSVTFTAGATCGGTPAFQWFVGTVHGSSINWQQVQAYSTSTTFTWNTTGLALGTYYVSDWVENEGGPSTSFDQSAAKLFSVVAQAPCSSLSESASPAGSDVTVGSTITVTASATCGGTPVYQWFVGSLHGSSISWQQVQAYSTSNTYVWNTTGLVTGSYYISPWAENQGGSSTSFDQSNA
jgi:hypothetical protein